MQLLPWQLLPCRLVRSSCPARELLPGHQFHRTAALQKRRLIAESTQVLFLNQMFSDFFVFVPTSNWALGQKIIFSTKALQGADSNWCGYKHCEQTEFPGTPGVAGPNSDQDHVLLVEHGPKISGPHSHLLTGGNVVLEKFETYHDVIVWL